MSEKPEPQPDGTPFTFQGVIDAVPGAKLEGIFSGNWKNGLRVIEYAHPISWTLAPNPCSSEHESRESYGESMSEQEKRTIALTVDEIRVLMGALESDARRLRYAFGQVASEDAIKLMERLTGMYESLTP